MRRILTIVFVLALALSVSMLTLPVAARNNTVSSSTMIFEGDLTDAGGGVYTGYIPMVQESVGPKGDGEDGFDLYAEQGGCAYCQGYYGSGGWNCGGTDTYDIGYYAGHDYDAYPGPVGSGPWGAWYDPDCADWNQYSLELTADHWYLRYTATNESPMSGTIEWYGDGTGYAWESDPGTDDGTDPTQYGSGSPQEWGWDCGWGEERIPLQYEGFRVTVASGGSYVVTLTPAAAADTTTGTGTASFSTSAGVIEDLTSVATPAGAPKAFPHGMFTFKITGLNTSQEITLTVELPDPVPVGTRWYKYHNNVWSMMDIGDDDGDNVITVALKDGRIPDDEDNDDGQITDQGGPAYAGNVGWETYRVSKTRVLLPWIALSAAVAAGIAILARRRIAQS